MKFAGWYAIIGGALMLAQWAFFLLTGQVSEFQTEPYRIAFHLVGEGVTTVVLMISGLGLLCRRTPAREIALVALGMLFYTAIVSPGYFAQQRQWALVLMFVVLLVLGVASLYTLIRRPHVT